MGLSDRKKKNYDLDENVPNLYNPIYNYSSLEIEENDKGTLISLEKDVLYRGKMLGEIAYKIGESLEKAKTVFKKYSTTEGDPESFVTWYSALGLNKDQVYLFRGRYNLCLNNTQHKERIISLSDVAIKETINSKTPVEIKEKVLDGELNSGAAIKKARVEIIQNQKSRPLEIEKTEAHENNNSRPLEIDIEEAEIIETNSQNRNLNEESEKIEEKLKEIKELILNSPALKFETKEEMLAAKKKLTRLITLSINVTDTFSEKVFAIEEKLENVNNLKFPE